MVEDILKVIIAAGLVMVLVWATGVRADEECYAFAAFVETAEQTEDEARKARQWAAWLKLARNHQQTATILRARNWVTAGNTATEAWRTCPNY